MDSLSTPKHQTTQHQDINVAKEQPVHYDRIGQQVNVGDIVAVADFNGLMLAKVTKLNQKMIKVQRFPKPYRDGKGRNKYAHDAIKLDRDEVAIHVLQGGE
jgi:hypothetical protein